MPDPEIARATFDKYEAHLLLTRLGLPSPPTVLPGEPVPSFPVMIKPRQGSGARSIHPARDAEAAEFFVRYVEEPTMVQRLMDGPEFSIDCLSDLTGRCLNAIPRTMIESRGGESIKGTVIDDRELVDLGRRVVETLGVRGPCTVQVFRDREIGLGITDVNTRFGGAFPAPMYAALPGRTYPELIVRMARERRSNLTWGSSAPASVSRATSGSSSSTSRCGRRAATSSTRPAPRGPVAKGRRRAPEPRRPGWPAR